MVSEGATRFLFFFFFFFFLIGWGTTQPSVVLGAALSMRLESATSVAGRAAACPNYGARLVAGEQTLGGGRGAYDTIGLDNPDTHDVEVANVEPKPPKPKYGREKGRI